MPLITYSITCTKKVLIARGVYELRFTKPAGFTFTAGQFVLFDVPLVDTPNDVQTRALSVASAPDEPDLLFVISLVPGGRLGRWIGESLTVGSSVTFKGPFGNFTLKTDDGTKPLLFIATGAGIAPFRPMVIEAARRAADRRIDIVFGVRSEEDIFWQDWLAGISKNHAHVFHHITLSRGSPSWTGHRGRVQIVAPQVVGNDFSQKILYVCGNPDMTTDVKRLALGEWGIEKKDLHVEGYI